jgi:hypothetical protein
MGRSDAGSGGRGNQLYRNDLLAFAADREWRSGASRGNPDAALCHEQSPKKTQSPTRFDHAGFARGDSMPDIQTDLVRPVPSIVPSEIPAMSDDECLLRLAKALEDRDSERLDEVARLIGRLAVTIE